MSLFSFARTAALAALAAVGLVACSARGGGPSSQNADSAVEAEPEPQREPFRVLSPTERAPSFRVVATNGTVFDSDGLIQKQPFVVVFFATWCDVCELKLPEIVNVLSQTEAVPTIGVSVDDADTWRMVPGYVTRHRLGFPTVRAASFPRFALAYDPMQTVPVVAVVGRNGYLVDYQIGWSSTHRQRFAAALEVARRLPVDAPALYGPGGAGVSPASDVRNPPVEAPAPPNSLE